MGQHHAQDLAAGSPCSAYVAQTFAKFSTAEPTPSSHEATVTAGAPPDSSFRPPVVSPSDTSDVSASTTLRASSGLIHSRTLHRSAAPAGTPRTPVDDGFGRRPLVTTTSRPSVLRRRLPTPSVTRLPQPHRSSTTRSRTTQDPLPLASVSTATGSASTLPQIDRPPAYTVPRPTASAVQAPTPTSLRLPEPATGPVDERHLRSCVECFTHIDWDREQRAEPTCSVTIRFISLDSPSPPPDDLLDYIPSSRRPLLSKVIALATKG